jgi:hypothetical protein
MLSEEMKIKQPLILTAVLYLFLLIVPLFGCTSEKDKLKHRINDLTYKVQSDLKVFHTDVLLAKQSLLSDDIDSLFQRHVALERSLKNLKHLIDSSKTTSENHNYKYQETKLINLSNTFSQVSDDFIHVKSISELIMSIKGIESRVYSYQNLSQKVAALHFMADVDTLMQLKDNIDQQLLRWKTRYDSLKSDIPINLSINMLDKWQVAHEVYNKSTDQLYINFSKTVLYLMVKGDQKVSRLMDWHHLVLDADNHGQMYRQADLSTRLSIRQEVIQTTAGMFAFMFNLTKNRVTNVKYWRIKQKSDRSATVSALSTANEPLTFRIIILNNQILLSLLKTI